MYFTESHGIRWDGPPHISPGSSHIASWLLLTEWLREVATFNASALAKDHLATALASSPEHNFLIVNLLILTAFAIWIGRHLSIPSGPGSFPFNRSSLNVFLSHIISSKKKPGSIFQTWLKNLVCPSSFFTSSAFHTTERHNSAKFSAARMIRILLLQIPIMSFSLYPE